MGKSILRWARPAIGLAIVAYLVRFLMVNWQTIRTADIEWQIRPLLLIGSVGLTIGTYALLVEAWRRMVGGWGVEVAWFPAARIWILSSMGKYVPGKVWAIAGLAVLGREVGIPTWIGTAAAILLQVLSIGTGALVVALTGSAVLERVTPGARLGLGALVALTVGSMAVVLSARLRSILFRRISREVESIPSPRPGSVIFGLIANAGAWGLYGLSLYWLSAGVFGHSSLSLVQAIGAFTASYLAGFLFLLAPGGLGVRESVFVLLTEPALGPARALALAAVSRIGMTLADVLAAAPFALRRGPSRGQS